MITLSTVKIPAWLFAIVASAGIWLFAWLIHINTAAGIAGLVLTSTAIAFYCGDFSRLVKVSGLLSRTRHFTLTLIICIVLGATLGIYLNYINKVPLLPTSLKMMAVIAAGIGLSEELIFRGFLQGMLSEYRSITAIISASASHTIYKIIVLTTLPVILDINVLKLAVLTFGVGLLAGWARSISRSVIPPAIGHMVFDIIVYGALISSPVWVWG